jgi:O-antigen/teichoic acid export membrane protein
LVLALQILLSRRRKRGLSQDQASSRIQPETSNCRYDSSRIIPSALPIFATRISDLLIQYGNVFVLGMLAGPAVAAGFFVAERLSMLASVPRQVISSVIQPWMASAHAQDNRAELQKTITHAGHATLWPTILAVAILMIMGSLLLGMFGTEYRSTYPVLAILLISHLLGAALGPTQQVLIMSGNQGLVMKAMAVAASVHLIALVLLIPWLGALGAALANLLSTSVARIGCQFLVRSRLGLDPSVIAPLRQKTPSDRNHEND